MGIAFVGGSSTLRASGLSTWSAPVVRRFNPSLQLAAVAGECDRLALRVAGEVGSPPGAVLRSYVDGRLRDERDLTAECRAFGIDRVADPKLFSLDGASWATFNTGSPTSENALYLWCVGIEGARPMRCTFAGRDRIEKNWQFVRRGDRLCAVYSIDPLVILDAPMPTAGDDEVVFELRSGAPSSGSRSARQRIARRSVSLGTPLLAADADTFRLIVHEKFHLAGKRLYLGRAAELTFDGAPALRLSRDRLAHSWAGLMGTRPRLNPNLVSCTYFSGIAGDPDRPVLSFGLNDAHAGFVQCEWSEVFRP